MVEKKEQSQFEEYKYLVLVMGGSIIISILLIVLIGRPLFNSTQETSRELKSKLLTAEKLESKLKNLQNLENKKEELENQNKTVLAALPKDKDLARLFVQFESIFNEAGATISSVSESGLESTEENQSTIKSIAYQVTGTTNSYGSLKNALVKIENALRILSVSSINIAGEGNNLSITFKINTYTRNQ